MIHERGLLEERNLWLVNSRSGGGAGYRLLSALQRRFAERDVHDVTRLDLTQTKELLDRGYDRVIACGGDGTVASILETVYQLKRPGPWGRPAVGMLPLGTGNDLARWLGRFSPASDPLEKLDKALKIILSAPFMYLDRWLLDDGNRERPWYIYCSFGADARIASRFDTMRRQHPMLFRSPVTNKAIYAILGLFNRPATLPIRAFGRNWAQSNNEVLVCANIGSYAGGGRLGREVHSADAHLDCYAFAGALSLAMAVRGPREPQRLGRHTEIELLCDAPVVMQLDGEPGRIEPGRYVIRHGGQVPVLAPGWRPKKRWRRRQTQAIPLLGS